MDELDVQRKIDAVMEQLGILSGYRDRAKAAAEDAARAEALAESAEQLAGELRARAESLEEDADEEERKFREMESIPVEEFCRLPSVGVAIHPDDTDAQRMANAERTLAKLFALPV